MKYFKLGPKASTFFDPTNQKKVLPGQIVEFTDEDLLSTRTLAAIDGGHLVPAKKNEISDTEPQTPQETLKQRFQRLYTEKNKVLEDIIKQFKKEELVTLAEEEGFVVESSDTKETLAASIIEDWYSES